jgi:hypothetical protein
MWAFAVVGALFFLVPDGVAAFTDRVGSWLGEFSPAPATGFRLWHALTAGYMVLVSVLAWAIQRDVRGRRDLLLVLAAGKATSSASCLLFYLFDADVFAYLLNFLVDGAIVLDCLALHRLLDPRIAAAPEAWLAPGARGRTILDGVLATLLAEDGPGSAAGEIADELLTTLHRAGPGAAGALVPALLAIEFGTPLWLGTLRPFTRLAPDERARYLEGFLTSRWYAREQLLAPIRQLALLLYYARPAEEAAVGYEPPRLRRDAAEPR